MDDTTSHLKEAPHAFSPLRQRIWSDSSRQSPLSGTNTPGIRNNGGDFEFGSPFFNYRHRKHLIQENAKKWACNINADGKYPSGSTECHPAKLSQQYKWFDTMTTIAFEPDSSQLRKSLADLRKIISLRLQYQEKSVQKDEMNPRNGDDWKINPPHKSPFWKLENGHPVPLNETQPTLQEFLKDIPAPPSVCPDGMTYKFLDTGVYSVYMGDQEVSDVPSVKEYFTDLDFILSVITDGPTKSFCYRRLEYLEARFQMYTLLNESREISESKAVSHRDFYNVRKVDTHVHLASSMNQKHLLRFIKSKMKKCPDEVVIFRDGKHLTLRQVFESLGLTAYDLSIDTLDMHANKDIFHRFDKFNLKYNPIGESRLREIFMKTNNYVHGKYLAEITRELMNDLEASKYQHAEYRVSVYGRHPDEWKKLAAWVVDNELFSDNVRWLVQVPRLYSIYKVSKQVNNFADIMTNIFEPLFAVTQNPQADPKLHLFLQRVVGFDSVDDEGKPEKRIHRKYPAPKEWNSEANPPYSYYMYYMYANLTALNQWRKRRGFNCLLLRPHSGEAGDVEHLASAFLTSHSISHGIVLRKSPTLQYLFYLMQIGIAMSPMSNNALWLTYERNPFPKYMRRGLNVSLSTDDPLQFHFTKEPLIEEYSVAVQIYKLSAVDMCELARNSVLQSGWEAGIKKLWLGNEYDVPGPYGNDINKTNIPNVRIFYRFATYMEELQLVIGEEFKPSSEPSQLQARVPSASDQGAQDPVVPHVEKLAKIFQNLKTDAALEEDAADE